MASRMALLIIAVSGCTAAPTTEPVSTGAGAAWPRASDSEPRAVAPEPPAPIAAPSAAPTSAASALPPPKHEGPLATFYDALRALERGERKQHVRAMWLGDSHAQADFWPDAVRGGLQQRFGNAGPGFVHLGFKAYRHAEVKIEVQGKWRFRPKQPSTVEPWDDGAFGLGGILHAGFAERRWATIALHDEQLASREMIWDLCYKPGLPEDDVVVTLGGATMATLRADGDIGTLRHVEGRATGHVTLKADIKHGRMDFCGVTIETDGALHPGVVLDNLGINGARYGTALAWNEAAWAAEVSRRMPDLFIFEYGGNEASDGAIQPQLYAERALALIARARRIRADVSCLVIGPTDRVDAESKIPPIVEALKGAAATAGCMFWNTYEAMGGRGSLRIWRDDDRAAPDGIHLKPKGYAEVGALLLADLMAGYTP
jgi:lysophospholipase L1-like esterase